MSRLGFGAFRRDLDLVEHLDKLGYDEFWCGEHHSRPRPVTCPI
jgi:alkanesulfonate monooxygenase SsuD/methylene tetrahydromethanopterin reductase-like flavin-dependent oxidoreductase (luciferase family)